MTAIELNTQYQSKMGAQNSLLGQVEEPASPLSNGEGGHMTGLRDRRPREPACTKAPPPKPAHRNRRAEEYGRKKTAWSRLSASELSGSHPGLPLSQQRVQYRRALGALQRSARRHPAPSISTPAFSSRQCQIFVLNCPSHLVLRFRHGHSPMPARPQHARPSCSPTDEQASGTGPICTFAKASRQKRPQFEELGAAE